MQSLSLSLLSHIAPLSPSQHTRKLEQQREAHVIQTLFLAGLTFHGVKPLAATYLFRDAPPAFCSPRAERPSFQAAASNSGMRG